MLCESEFTQYLRLQQMPTGFLLEVQSIHQSTQELIEDFLFLLSHRHDFEHECNPKTTRYPARPKQNIEAKVGPATNSHGQSSSRSVQTTLSNLFTSEPASTKLRSMAPVSKNVQLTNSESGNLHPEPSTKRLSNSSLSGPKSDTLTVPTIPTLFPSNPSSSRSSMEGKRTANDQEEKKSKSLPHSYRKTPAQGKSVLTTSALNQLITNRKEKDKKEDLAEVDTIAKIEALIKTREPEPCGVCGKPTENTTDLIIHVVTNHMSFAGNVAVATIPKKRKDYAEGSDSVATLYTHKRVKPN
eukprot:TRINITY_DN5801_c0_g1_i2.p1 TRINITY_DN5801_c0_g1~~TRINITY_DN5801_c0_g1_i2.p1  ORF type:complete len:299 (-),score=8.29 TRINITY_DN5801_c0_g1_i2:278-1174(-)